MRYQIVFLFCLLFCTENIQAQELSGNVPISGPVYYFLPEMKAQVLSTQKEMIDGAKKSVSVAAYGFTNDNPIVDELVGACKRGVRVRVYRDEIQSSSKKSALSNDQIVKACGKDSVRIKKSAILMHSKYFVSDGELVLFGSYNFSASGLKQDNVVETNDSGQVFESNFEEIWKTGIGWDSWKKLKSQKK